MAPVVVYCHFISPRLTYVLDWVFNEQLQTGYTLTDDIAVAKQHAGFISYGAAAEESFSIPSAGLLQKTGIEHHEVKTGMYKGTPVLYAVGDTGYTLGFDLFSAIFSLLSRYEEYLSPAQDKHGRYPASESILYKTGNLERPLVDEWIAILRHYLSSNYSIPALAFKFLPTYDIDIAYSYRHKSMFHTLGGFAKDILSGNIERVKERSNSLVGNTDPFDSFGWLYTLHRSNSVQPIYFILCALRTTAFDKNIAPGNPAMKKLIKELAEEGAIGLHPSYYSDKNTGIFSAEKNVLTAITGKAIRISRQHYIKNKIPGTYKLLQDNNITEDYSMGYATHLGFRAGTGRSFLWYNLEEEKVTGLRIYPFCFMDTAARFECKLEAGEAFERLEKMKNYLHHTGSTLITVFHNFSLGTDNGWKGWKELYEDFIRCNSSIS